MYIYLIFNAFVLIIFLPDHLVFPYLVLRLRIISPKPGLFPYISKYVRRILAEASNSPSVQTM
jgi:hypothetical protein